MSSITFQMSEKIKHIHEKKKTGLEAHLILHVLHVLQKSMNERSQPMRITM